MAGCQPSQFVNAKALVAYAGIDPGLPVEVDSTSEYTVNSATSRRSNALSKLCPVVRI